MDLPQIIFSALIWGRGQTSFFSQADPVDLVLAGLAVVLVLVSLAFTAFTLFSYDGLMMPPEVWSEGFEVRGEPRWSVDRPPKWSVGRPPSQAHVVLLYEMMHVWKVFFVPAIVSAFAAVAVLLVALAHASLSVRGNGWVSTHTWESLVGLLVIAALALLAPVMFYVGKRPRFGSED